MDKKGKEEIRMEESKQIEIRTEGLPLKRITEFIAMQGNLKIMDERRLKKLMENIIQNGFIAPVFIWQNNIIDGHQRLKALGMLIQQGYTLCYKGKNVEDKVPFIIINAKDRQEAAKFILTYNSQYGQMVGLDEFLSDFKLNWEDIDGQLMLTNEYNPKFGKSTNKLKENWVMPPFSILDTRQTYWQDRRTEWYNIIGNTASFTREGALGGDLIGSINEGVSLFDPVLAEIIFKWFCPAKGSVLNLFAGDVEPNIVAAYQGHELTGIELRQEQIEHTIRIANKIQVQNRLNIACDDVLNMDKYAKDEDYDIIFSCPPYYDLEEYSEDERDFANKEECDFDSLLQGVINAGAKKLKNNRFAVFVVTEVRRPDGSYRGFIPKVIRWFESAGLKYYNEIILINSIGTLPFRINKAWQNRKVGKMHQNVLVFFKGKDKNIEKEFDKTRQVGHLHQKVMVFFKGNIENIKREFERQEENDQI
jgi:16S rRNA G966 N2-methylase RsmD